jgi:hypothetical protein
MTSIDDVIARIPDWHGRDVRVLPLAGGLTNTNYRVDVDGTPYVIRVPGQSTELLSVNRQHEYHNTLAAADAGVGARIVHYLPDIPVMVLEFIPGPTMSSARLRAPEQIARIVAHKTLFAPRIVLVIVPTHRFTRLQGNGHDDPCPNVRASPFSGAGKKLHANMEI